MRKAVSAFCILCSVLVFDMSPEALAEKQMPLSGLISRGYGIVTAADLAKDADVRISEAYDRTKNQLGRYWQCVPSSLVKREYNANMGEDGMGPAGTEILMCDLEIIIDLPEGRQVYGDRRRHPNSFCKEFERSWRRLTRGEKTVCFSGDDPSNADDQVFGKYRSWVWNEFKTKKGCYSYFNDCGEAW